MDLNKIFVALDYQNFDDAKNLVETLGDDFNCYKVGQPLYTVAGNEIIKFLKDKGKRIFLDLKFFDIPSVIMKAAENLVKQKIDFFTVHSLAGSELLGEIAGIVKNSKTTPLGVTILTSIAESKIADVLLIEKDFNQTMKILINRVIDSGIPGLVCSPKEIDLVRSIDTKILIVTPGIRLEKDNVGDQSRIMTPGEAMKAGSNYLVMGRSITGASSPKQIAEQLKSIVI